MLIQSCVSMWSSVMLTFGISSFFRLHSTETASDHCYSLSKSLDKLCLFIYIETSILHVKKKEHAKTKHIKVVVSWMRELANGLVVPARQAPNKI